MVLAGLLVERSVRYTFIVEVNQKFWYNLIGKLSLTIRRVHFLCVSYAFHFNSSYSFPLSGY